MGVSTIDYPVLSHDQTMRYMAAYKAGFIGRLWADSSNYRLAAVGSPDFGNDYYAESINLSDLIDKIDRCYPLVDTTPRKPVSIAYSSVHETWRELIRRA